MADNNSRLQERQYQIDEYGSETDFFLSLLGETHTFQTFDDSKEKNIGLAKVFHGELSQYKNQLEKLNSQGNRTTTGISPVNDRLIASK